MTAQVVTANRLGDGAVIYLTPAGDWSEAIELAQVAHDKNAAAALLSVAEAPAQRVRVVGPYLMDVFDDTGPPRPASIREAIRALGPTVRTDLSRRAERA